MALGSRHFPNDVRRIMEAFEKDPCSDSARQILGKSSQGCPNHLMGIMFIILERFVWQWSETEMPKAFWRNQFSPRGNARKHDEEIAAFEEDIKTH